MLSFLNNQKQGGRLNIIHSTESNTKEITDGQIVLTRCGKKIAFHLFGNAFTGGKLCQTCSTSSEGGYQFLLAVLEVEAGEKKSLTQSASA